MQKSIDPSSEAVAQAASHVARFSERQIHLFSFVPDDRLTWAPSPTAKSSLRIVAHCALSNAFFSDVITGSMAGSMPSPEEFFRGLNEAEEKITTRGRGSAIALLKETAADLCKAIGTVNAENISSMQNSPFGPLPMQFWMHQGGEHMARHAGQMEYLQTVWGDLDNHFS